MPVSSRLTSSITIVVVPWNARLVDGQLLKIGATISVQLGIKVREKAALKQRVFCEVNAPYDVTRLELKKLVRPILKDRELVLTITCSVSAK